MKTSYATLYLIGGLMILLGLCSGSPTGGHLVISGIPATCAKAGAVLTICGWLVELVYLVKIGK